MITFRAMSLLAATVLGPSARSWLLACVCGVAVATSASGQTSLSHVEDAAPLPRGMLRLRAINAWTRFDERFTANGRRSLGDELSTDALGTAQLPLLAPIDTGLQTLSGGSGLHLSLGRLVTGSGVRIVTTPIALEYGVTRRLSVGVLVPVVQTRRTIQVAVNADSSGNVALLPAASRASAAQMNLAVYSALRNAADSLGRLLANCPSSPTAMNCAGVNANAADAAAVRALSLAYAAALQRAVGTDATGAVIAPRTGTALALAIEEQRLAITARIRQYLGATAGPATGIFTTTRNFSYIDLNGRSGAGGLLASTLGGGLDSLATTERYALGDVAIGARYLVMDRFEEREVPVAALRWRLMAGGALRFATSRPDSSRNIIDIGTGDGAGFDLSSTLDVARGHAIATVGARYSQSLARTIAAPTLGDPESIFPYPEFGVAQRTSGSVLGLDVTPRVLLSEWLSLNLLYGVERVGGTRYVRATDTITEAALTSQRAGLGVRFSTVDAYLRGAARYPVDVTFNHLATLTGSPGLPALSRDQIQVRLYYRLIGR